MLSSSKIPVIQATGKFDTTRVSEVRVIRVGKAMCVTMMIEDEPQIYEADPTMLEYLSNTYGESLDIIGAIKPSAVSYVDVAPQHQPVKRRLV